MVNFMGRIRDIHSQYTRLQRAPLLMLYCRDTFPLDVPRQQQLFDHTIQKRFPATVKTYVDTDIKLQTTLHVMRACRLANYVFCANTPSAALVLELPFDTSYMPKVPVLTAQLQLDLSAYKSAAIHYLERYPLDVVDGKYHDPRRINAGSFGNATCYFCRIGMHSLQLQLLFDRRPVVAKGFLQHTPVVLAMTNKVHWKITRKHILCFRIIRIVD